MYDSYREHREFHYDSLWDHMKYQAQVDAIESDNKKPWIITSADVWIKNPNYDGPTDPYPMHPEEAIEQDYYIDEEAKEERNKS